MHCYTDSDAREARSLALISQGALLVPKPLAFDKGKPFMWFPVPGPITRHYGPNK